MSKSPILTMLLQWEMTELRLQQAEFAKSIKILYSAITEQSARLLDSKKLRGIRTMS